MLDDEHLSPLDPTEGDGSGDLEDPKVTLVEITQPQLTIQKNKNDLSNNLPDLWGKKC